MWFVLGFFCFFLLGLGLGFFWGWWGGGVFPPTPPPPREYSVGNKAMVKGNEENISSYWMKEYLDSPEEEGKVQCQQKSIIL